MSLTQLLLHADIHGIAAITRYGMNEPVSHGSRAEVLQAVLRAYGVTP